MSSILWRAEVSEIPLDKCIQIYRERAARNLDDGQQASNFVCINSTVSDTCQGDFPCSFILKFYCLIFCFPGDSGSGLHLVPSNYYGQKRFVYGITAAGVKCQTPIPGLATRVSSHLDWIENIVWPVPAV